jgi:predicted HAD superfamily phosphohydrolase YqeG
MSADDSFLPSVVTDLRGALILLDIDGTVTHDYTSSVVEPAVAETIRMLSQSNRVVAITNSRNFERSDNVARQLGIERLATEHRKPSKKIISTVENYQAANTVVIGDKFLTDGLFASNIGAKFFKAKRLVSAKDSLKTRLGYLLDDIIYTLLKPFFKRIFLQT